FDFQDDRLTVEPGLDRNLCDVWNRLKRFPVIDLLLVQPHVQQTISGGHGELNIEMAGVQLADEIARPVSVRALLVYGHLDKPSIAYERRQPRVGRLDQAHGQTSEERRGGTECRSLSVP